MERHVDHPRSHKSDFRTGFGDEDVAQRGKARRNASEGGIGEHDNVRQPGPIMRSACGSGFGHLHQRKHALLHARAPAGHRAEHRPAPARGVLERIGDLLPNHRSHRPAHEVEIEHDQDDRVAFQARLADHDGLPQPGPPPCLDEPVPVRPLIGEAEGVDRDQAAVQLLERARVGQHRDPLAGRHL